MSDEKQDIKITISADDQASAAFRAAGQAAQDFSKKTESARLAAWGLGEAAENAAQSLGVPNQISRQLGNSVENLARRFGGATVAFGALGLAGMALYGVYQFVIERQKKLAEEARKAAEAKERLRNELIKNGDAAAAWLSKADSQIAKTREIVALEYELYKIEFERNKEALRAGIYEQEKKLLDIKGKSMDFVVIEGAAIEVGKNRNKNLELEIQHLERKLDLQRQQLKESRMQSSAEFGGDNKGSREIERQLEARARLGRDAQNRVNEAVIAAKNAQIEQEKKNFEEELKMLELRKHAYWDMGESVVQSFQMLAQAGGSHARKWFSMWKVAAISEATVKGIQAVINSYEFGTKIGGPAMGGAMAAVASLAMAAKLAQLKSTEFGAGTGAVGTYAASPGTGLPTSQPSFGNLTIIMQDSRGNETGKQEMALSLAHELYRSGGQIGQYKFQVVRTG